MIKIQLKGNKFRKIRLLILVLSLLVVAGCKHDASIKQNQEKDLNAMKIIQGVWADDISGSATFLIKGDSVYYPDPMSEPAKFYIAEDTLYLLSSHPSKYHLLKITRNLLKFTAENGDETTLVKTHDKSLIQEFNRNNKSQVSDINQGKLIKNDTVVVVGTSSLHAYIQVNPTSFKVFKPYMNEDGVSVDHVYYDNIVHLALYKGATPLINRDYRKQDFKNLVDKEYIKQSILSDIVVDHVTDDGVCFVALLTTPETFVSYNVNIIVNKDGKVHLSL